MMMTTYFLPDGRAVEIHSDVCGGGAMREVSFTLVSGEIVTARRAPWTDERSEAVERNLGGAAARWADRNASGWVLDRLADPSICLHFALRVLPVDIVCQLPKWTAELYIKHWNTPRAARAIAEVNAREIL